MLLEPTEKRPEKTGGLAESFLEVITIGIHPSALEEEDMSDQIEVVEPAWQLLESRNFWTGAFD